MALPFARSSLRKRWFLLALVAMIVGGMLLGARMSESALSSLARVVRPTGITAAILFLMSFSLDSHLLRQTVRSPGPVLWASLVNIGLIPALAWGLMDWQLIPDFKYGLLIVGAVPCTLAAASVWTRKAGGNDAISLLVTLVTNAACFLVTPFWLNAASVGRPIDIDSGSMVLELGVFALLPTLAGQVVRQFRAPGMFADRHKLAIGVLAQLLILSMILRAACNAGAQIEKFGTALSGSAILMVWGTCVALHLFGLGISLIGARKFGMSPADQAAVAFAGSQKTLPIGILLATNPKMFGDPDLLGPGLGIPFAVFPMLMYHASQLFIDTLVADHLAARSHIEPLAAADDVTGDG